MLKLPVSAVVVALVLFLCASPDVMAAEQGDAAARVMEIRGSARVYSRGAATGRLLKKGDGVLPGQEIAVAGKSRIELQFPDGTVMRLADNTRFKVNELMFNRQTSRNNVRVGLSTGRLWAKVRKLMTPDSSVEVSMPSAVAGVRGTVYRVNVDEDRSALVKVYDGSVYVANPPRDASAPADRFTAPHEVAGPHEVPPPVHEVSMEEWTYIVKAMQQITISPQGVATKPREFDPAADADDWVRWNQERDREASF